MKKEISILQNEVSLLKNQINKLVLNKKLKENIDVKKTKKVVLNLEKYRIKASSANIRDRAFPSAKIVEVLSKGTLVSIESCNKFAWCKFKDEKKFVSRFLLEK